SRRRRLSSPQTRDAIDRQHDAEEDSRAADIEAFEWAEELIVLAAHDSRPGEMEPVHGSARVRDRMVGHTHEESHVLGLIHRPTTKRPVAQVVADEHLLGYQPRLTFQRIGEALPGA